jgi:protease-4
MSRLESTKRLLRRWFTSIPFFVVVGLILGLAIAVPAIPRPKIATIEISGAILDQAYADEILDTVRHAKDDNSIKAVVLAIDSPGGEASVIEQIYSDVLRLRGQKPVVACIESMGASGGYYIAVASDFIYAQPSSQLGSIGAWSSLPSPEKLDEELLTTGLFKATGGSRSAAVAELEMIRQEFVSAVKLQRGDRLKLSSEELSLARVYPGVEGLRYGLIDDIGTVTAAMQKAADLAGIRNYEVVKPYASKPSPSAGSSAMEELKSRTGLMPAYYYLCFESE